MNEIYEFAQENQVPVMTHCSPPVVFYRGKIKDEMLEHPVTHLPLKKEKNKPFAKNWTNPDNYKILLERYPKLKICFGHFGGSTAWKNYYNHTTEEEYKQTWFYKIKELLLKYPNAYADVSYTLADADLLPVLNLLMTDDRINGKILFGSDFYMANIEGREFRFSVSLRNAIGEDNFRKIADENPRKYLNSKFQTV